MSGTGMRFKELEKGLILLKTLLNKIDTFLYFIPSTPNVGIKPNVK